MIYKFIIYIYITNNYEYYLNKEVKQNIKLNPFSSYINIFNEFKHGFDYLLKLNDNINININRILYKLIK